MGLRPLYIFEFFSAGAGYTSESDSDDRGPHAEIFESIHYLDRLL